jgi:tetratricopeptide (TPR) repeat protein
MVLLPLVAFGAAWLSRKHVRSAERRALLFAGLGVAAGLEMHGLTDQVLTTNLGTALLLLGIAAVLATTPVAAGRVLARCGLGVLGAVAVLVLVLGALVAAWAPARSAALMDLGGLQLDAATFQRSQVDPDGAAQATRTLEAALAANPDSRAAQRTLARARLAQFDVAGTLALLQPLTASPSLDAFDMLQIAHLYRDLGFSHDAYQWASRAYQTWGRPASVPVMHTYLQAALPDDARVRTLVDQAEAATRGADYRQAIMLYQAALTFDPDDAYLLDRIGDAERAAAK